MLVKKDIDEKERERLFNIALRDKLQKRNNVFIAVLHFIRSIIYDFLSSD